MKNYSVDNKYAHSKGFEDLDEMNRMIAQVSSRTPKAHRRFTEWMSNDGSKEGLKKILEEQKK